MTIHTKFWKIEGLEGLETQFETGLLDNDKALLERQIHDLKKENKENTRQLEIANSKELLVNPSKDSYSGPGVPYPGCSSSFYRFLILLIFYHLHAFS